MDLAEHQTASLTTHAIVADAEQFCVTQATTIFGIRVEAVKKVEAEVLDVILVKSALLKGFENNVVGSLAALNVDHRGAAAVEDDSDQSLVGRQSAAVCSEVVDAGAGAYVASDRTSETWRSLARGKSLRRLGQIWCAAALLHGDTRTILLVYQGRGRARVCFGEVLAIDAAGEAFVAKRGGRRLYACGGEDGTLAR
jgi:hypothetical protein